MIPVLTSLIGWLTGNAAAVRVAIGAWPAVGPGSTMVAAQWTPSGTATATQLANSRGMVVYSGSSHTLARGGVTRAQRARPWRTAVKIHGVGGPNGNLGISAIDAAGKAWVLYYNANSSAWQVYRDVVTPGTFVAVTGVLYSPGCNTYSVLSCVSAASGAITFTWSLSATGLVADDSTISASAVDVASEFLGGFGGTPGVRVVYVEEVKS